MNFRSAQIFFLIEAALLAFCLFPEYYRELVIITFIVSLLRLFHKIGNGSFFLELIYVYSAFTCLVMPLIGYVYFPASNFLAAIWVRFMPIPEQQYFSFNLPAVILMGWGFFLFRKNSPDDASVVNPLIAQLRKDILTIPPSTILTLTFVSLFSYSVSNFLPASVRQVNTFLYYSLFASFFYIIFYKGFPFKKYLVLGFIIFLVFDALRYGMFTIIAYMGGLFMILLLAGRKVLVSQKLMLIMTGVLFIVFLQLFKLDLRRSRKKGEDPSITEVATRVVSTAQDSDFEEILFPMYFRMNQGFNIALVQKRIPSQLDYLGGDYLALSFASAFVPRLFWPDKPEAGGKANMRMYAGKNITTWSTNIGPIGEAYGNFGFLGGWFYIFAFGMFIRVAYSIFISVCKQRTTFFLWMPPILFQTVYVIETDSLQAFNSLIKGAVFMFLMFKLFPTLFPTRIK
jgi:hypothetical protein